MHLAVLKKALPAAAVAIVGALAGSWATLHLGQTPFNLHEISAAAASAEAVPQINFQNGFQGAVKKALPSVVNISSTKVVRTSGPGSPFESDPMFRQFFGNGRFNAPREQRSHGLGSGVITSRDGYILTNNHVVDGADEVKVALGDKREFTAKVVGTDKRTDLAVLRIEAGDLPAIILGDSSQVHVGEFALAIGNPFGVGQTVTMGIVSATGRGGLGIEDYEDFIQTDAAINPGNSGGALVNAQGDLIGINTAIVSGSGGNNGVGFAIPVNMARNVAEQIMKHGKVTRGWLGVSVQPVSADIAKAFHLPGETKGALIGGVTKGSPAEKAGLKSGDIVLVLNGHEIEDSRDLSLKVAQLAPGGSAKLKVFRDGREREENVTLGEGPGNQEAAGVPSEGPGAAPKLGISVQPVTPEIARELGVSERTSGLAVTSVESGSAAEEAGLRTGDVILEANRKTVTTVAEFQQAVRGSGTEPVLLLVNRGGNRIFVPVKAR